MSSRPTSGGRSKGPIDWLGGVLLNLLAVLGVVCIVLVILGIVSNVSIMMFRTGSMSPTITAGSIAFVREIPAEEMAVGDVVTVDRGPDVLPVTHRVISILDTDEQTGAVTFEMRGDANEAKDPEPYVAESVRRVMFSVPGLAPIIQEFRNPYVLGGITVGASLLVVWAFWPRRDDEDDEVSDGEEPVEGGHTERVDDFATNTDRSPSRSPGSRSPRHALVLPVVAVFLAAGGGPTGATLDRAPDLVASEQTSPARPGQTEAHGQFLHLRAVGDETEMLSLSPGSSANWNVDVWADAPEPGQVSVEIGSGDTATPLSEELIVDVRVCAHLAALDDCPGGADRIVNGVPLDELGAAPDHDRFLLTMSGDEQRRIQVTVSLRPNADARAVAGQTSDVRVTAHGQGEEVSLGPGDPGPSEPGPSGELPWTGIEGWQWLLLAGIVLLGAGLTAVIRTRRSSR
ncbi:signal peptidase I [Brevibacterium sanguinis]|uniref:Signal peptidase I n=2 Tax=Brevibacterium TaxID=1696 RepID=A0A366IN07_9MICO|nr:signal peptidase I [Brevibacterium sanguinis]RBP74464.1 signal peptidase I [Brevibacterium celere]